MLVRRVIFLMLAALMLACPALGEEVYVKAYGVVAFSPNGGCTEALVRRINEARSEVLAQCYLFTSKRIAAALIDAGRRGVKVHVLADPSNLKTNASLTRTMADKGVDVLYDSAHAIAHNKVMIFDGRAVATGSFNFTGAAERSNAENLLILEDAGLAALYARNWREHAAHSKPAEKSAAPAGKAPAKERGDRPWRWW